MPAPSQRAPAMTGHRDPALDGLRGLAILLVFVFHYGGGLRAHNTVIRGFGYLTQAGWVGVELFFVLSGFLITGLLWTNLEGRHGLRNFFVRRALRILPLYVLALFAAACAALAFGTRLNQLRPLLLYVGFLQNVPSLVDAALHYPRPLPLNHLWTLAVEEQFYLVWPCLLLMVRTRRQAFWLSLVVFAVTCGFRLFWFRPIVCTSNQLNRWSPFLLTRAGALVLGAALALRDGRTRVREAGLLCFAGLVGFGWVSVLNGSFLLDSSRQMRFGLPCVECACAGALAWSLHAGVWRALLCSVPLRFFGRISYSFYVLHVLLEPVFNWAGALPLHSATGMPYLIIRMLMALVITTVAATLSFRYLEQPFLRWKRFFPRRPAMLV